MSEYIGRAHELVSRADRKLRGFFLFGNKYEEAAEYYEKAANQYKLGKAWNEAGETYIKLADVNLKLESKHDAASAYAEAAKAYQKIDQKKAVGCLQKAVALYTDMGRLSMAARQLKEIAETLEKEGEAEQCIMFYEQAADMYSTENSTAEANKCNLKIAQLSAELEKYGVARDIYESVARAAVDNNLLKFGAKGHLLHAGLCCLCYMDANAINEKLERYKDIDVNFDNSREYKLLEDLTAAFDARDADAFTSAVAEFDSLTRLDSFKTAMLLRAKRRLEREDIDEEDLT